jgi:hypothetical protein
MAGNALRALVDQVAADGRVSSEEALRLRQQVFPDGVVSRDEADALIDLAQHVANIDSAWEQCFAEVLVDHVLQNGAKPNVDDADAAWLAARLNQGKPQAVELQALLKLLDRADSVPELLRAFVRARLSAFMAGRPVSAADVEFVRRCLYAGDAHVQEDEARWLFTLDAESDGRANDPAWQDLFVKAVMNHLMGSYAPALLDAADMRRRQAWLEDTHQTPVSNLMRMLSGGFKSYRDAVRSPNMVDALEEDYEALNANAEEDAQLTLMERAWAVGMTKEDGKLTANERALLAVLDQAQTPTTA